LSAYLDARGLLGDPRIGTSYAWNPKELIAEDYRQLFGTPGARSARPLNGEIAAAGDVPGLSAFLAGAFRSAP
jgi:hypothetical protein